MATRPANQTSSEGSVPVRGKAKPGAKKPAAKPAAKGRYDWGDGKRHSIPLSQHQDNATAQRMLGTQDLTAPPTGGQAIREANANADLQYGPQVTAAKQAATNTTPWFQDYQARVAGYAQAARTQMQPTLDQAGQLANPASAAQTQAAPGLDPNSEAGKAAGLAAQGRAALAALGQQALQTNAQSTQDYFGGLGASAAREQPQAQQAANTAVAQAESQRGQAVTGFLTNARQNAQNYQIARGTLGANIANSQADADTAAANTAETVRHNTASEADKAQARKDTAAAKGKAPNKYGVPAAQWDTWSTSHRQRVMDAYDKKDKGPSADDVKADEKKTAAIQKATGSAKVKVQDIQDAWARGANMPAPTPEDKNKTRPATRQELRNALGSKYGGTWVGIMERVRAKQPLTASQIDYLHSTDPNLRIPTEWLPKRGKGPQGSGGNAPAGNGQSRPT